MLPRVRARGGVGSTLCCLGFLAALCLLCGPAGAHGGPVYTSAPLVDGSGLRGSGSSYGLLVQEEDVFTWTCEEALGLESEPTFWHLTAQGRILAGTPAGVLATEDGGCSWEPSGSGLDGTLVLGVGADPEDADRLVLTQPSAAWLSEDGGLTWSELPVEPQGLALGGVLLGAGGQKIRITALRIEDGASVIAGSDDGGASWLEPLVLEGWSQVQPAGLSEDGGALYLSVFGADGGPWLVALDVDLTASTQTLAQLEAPALAALRYGEDFLVLQAGLGTFALEPEGVLVPIEGGPSRCLAAGQGELWGCGERPGEAQLLHSEDGFSWQPVLEFDAIEERDCEAGSPAAEACPLIWDLLNDPGIQPSDDDDDDLADGPDFDDDDDDDRQCSCDQPAGAGRRGGVSLLVLLLLLLPPLRRARTRA